MTESAGPDERLVEQELRDILDPLDRQLAWAASLVPLVILTVVPVVFFLLWHVYDWRFVRAAPSAAGVCCGLASAYMVWVMLASRLARWRFDRHFPAGSTARGVALRVLAEMESPSKAEEKLRQSLAGTSPDRIVRHRRDEPETRLDAINNAPTVAQPPRGQVQINAPPSAEPTRPGGYYDYIPLEPRPRDERGDDRPT